MAAQQVTYSFNHRHLIVDDVPKTVAFYEGTLGAKKIQELEFRGIPIVRLEMDGLPLTISQQIHAGVGDHIGLAVDDFEAAVAGLRDRAWSSSSSRPTWALPSLPSSKTRPAPRWRSSSSWTRTDTGGDTMASIPLSEIEIFGRGALQVEDVVIDKDGFVYGGGRNGIMYKVSPDGQVSELVQLPEGSIPNGVTMDKNGDLIYCDLGKQAVMRVTQAGQVSMIADRVGDVKLTLPNFATYDAEGNLFVSNTSTADINTVLPELSQPAPNGALVCIRPNGKNEVVATGIYAANGTAIDPRRKPSTSWKARATTVCVSP